MKSKKTDYELSRSQVDTPEKVVVSFWEILSSHRKSFGEVIDLGAGDCKFSAHGKFKSYTGIEIDPHRIPKGKRLKSIKVHNICAFKFEKRNYDACVGNPPYVKHNDLDYEWRDSIVKKIETELGITINKLCNLYALFICLSILKTKKGGIIGLIIPFEWVSRPSLSSIREYIKNQKWNVHVYEFAEHIFGDVLTTACIAVIDKSKNDGEWSFYSLNADGGITKRNNVLKNSSKVLQFNNRGKIWATRGLSPGEKNKFILTETERTKWKLRKGSDVVACITSLRSFPQDVNILNKETFQRYFVDSNERCWLLNVAKDNLSKNLSAYLASIEEGLKDNYTCSIRDTWYKFKKPTPGEMLFSSAFRKSPKIVINEYKVISANSVIAIHGEISDYDKLLAYLRKFDFRNKIVPYAKGLYKIEIRQLNGVLNEYLKKWLQ